MRDVMGSGVRQFVSWGWLFLAVSSSSPAYAETIPLTVDRSSDTAMCPDASGLAEAINRMVGRTALEGVVRQGRSTIGFHVKTFRSSAGLAATLLVAGSRQGERELFAADTESCDGLSEAIALSVSLILDGIDAERSFAPDESDESSDETTVVVESEEPSLERPTRPWRLTAEIGAGASYGMLEGFRPLIYGELQPSPWESVSPSVGLLWVVPDERGYPPGQVTISLTAATLGMCVFAFGSSDTARLALCSGTTVGTIRGSASGYTKDDSSNQLWFALGASTKVIGPMLPGLAWAAQAGFWVPMVKQRFWIEGLSTVYEQRSAAAFLTAGLHMSVF